MTKLISGRTIDDSEVMFNPDTYRFTYRGEDITRDLYFADQKNIGGWQFDGDTALVKHKGYGENLPTSTAGILLDQLVTDPLDAPIESLGNKANQVLANSGIQKLLVIGLILFAGYVFIAGGWFRRR